MQLPRQQLLEQCAHLERRYAEVERQLAEAAASRTEPKAYQPLSKELADLQEIVTVYRTIRHLEREAADAEHLAATQGDAELRELAKDEAASVRRRQAAALERLERLWLSRTQLPERPIIVEIRAGTGGLEASLFAADLYRMYTKYAARHGLTVEPMAGSPSEAGGLKDIAFAVKGAGAWQRFKYESGVHRVQRIPATEAQGRIHTSTATVAVLLEPEEVELPPIPSKDLQVDVYRASGPGGQGVNTTDSAVRIRHVPTGLVVTCQDERSQLQNKEKAMRVLRARLLDRVQQSQQEQIASSRRQQVGSGERSEKIRTYNFPDRRVTDHRIGLTLHKLDAVMEGELNELFEALLSADRANVLERSS